MIISEEQKKQKAELEESRLRFKFEFTQYLTTKAMKKIAREFPDLRAEDMKTLALLERLASNLLVDPERINGMSQFSLDFGAEFEANIIVNKTPYFDFRDKQTELFEQELNLDIEEFARIEGIRRPGFIPTDYDNITGWTASNVMQVKEIAEIKASQELDIKATDLSFNELESFVALRPDLYSTETTQALRLYRFVILTTLSRLVVSNLKQVLQEILLVSGSPQFADIAIRLGLQINLDNRRTLEVATDAENVALRVAERAFTQFRAIFPQLRKVSR